MLSTQGDDIDQMVTAERLAILKVFVVAASVMIVLSVLFASTIAGPVRRLAYGAESVRHRIRSRIEILDFTKRHDEIGHLVRRAARHDGCALQPHRRHRALRRRRRP